MTSNNAFEPRTYILGVAVTKESNMTSYFPEAGSLNGSNADMCSDVAGPSSNGSGDLFDFGSSSRSTTSTTGRHLGFERDYNFHTVFRGGVTSSCRRSITVEGIITQLYKQHWPLLALSSSSLLVFWPIPNHLVAQFLHLSLHPYATTKWSRIENKQVRTSVKRASLYYQFKGKTIRNCGRERGERGWEFKFSKRKRPILSRNKFLQTN